MITGCLAVIAAGLTLKASNTLAKRNRQGRLRASRAELPASLSAICEYGDAALANLNAVWPKPARRYARDVQETEEYMINITLPEFPRGILPNLMAVVEFADDSPVSQRIECIIREMQVFAARTANFRNGEALNLRQLSNYMIHAATIRALAESLFKFSRRQLDGVEETPLRETVRGVFVMHGLDLNPLLMAQLEHYRDTDFTTTETSPARHRRAWMWQVRKP